MDVLFILVPLSVVLVIAILVIFAWALRNGQLVVLEREGIRILRDDQEVPSEQVRVDGDQVAPKGRTEQSPVN